MTLPILLVDELGLTREINIIDGVHSLLASGKVFVGVVRVPHSVQRLCKAIANYLAYLESGARCEREGETVIEFTNADAIEKTELLRCRVLFEVNAASELPPLQSVTKTIEQSRSCILRFNDRLGYCGTILPQNDGRTLPGFERISTDVPLDLEFAVKSLQYSIGKHAQRQIPIADEMKVSGTGQTRILDTLKHLLVLQIESEGGRWYANGGPHEAETPWTLALRSLQERGLFVGESELRKSIWYVCIGLTGRADARVLRALANEDDRGFSKKLLEEVWMQFGPAAEDIALAKPRNWMPLAVKSNGKAEVGQFWPPMQSNDHSREVKFPSANATPPKFPKPRTRGAEILQALYNERAFNRNSRVSSDALVPMIYGEHALKESGNIRQTVSRQLRGFVESEEGAGGGYWLSDHGKTAFDAMRENPP